MTKKTRPTQAKKTQATGSSGQLTLAQARQLTQKKPEQPEGWKALGVQLMKVDRYEEAFEALSRALELSPNDAEAVARLGYVEHKLNKPEQALSSLNRALELAPDSLAANTGLARLYKDHGHYQKALAYAEAAERLSPKDIVVMDAKGGILHALYRFEEAMAIFDQLTLVDPKTYVHWNNAGNVRRDLSLLKEAADCYRKADSLADNNFTPYSNYLTSLHYLPEYSREAILTVCQEWETRFAPAKVPQRPHPSDSAPNKRIRIGMFSDGFRQHPVGRMTISALEGIDRSAFEFFAYSTSNVEDPLTRRFKKRVDHWALIRHLDDEDFAQRVRDDEIDILIDLSGHNSGNRMRTMAMQPAPLLVKWVGGLINTTGVTAIDYLISDSIETPAGEDEYYTEKLIRLPDDYICFEPPENAPTVQALPALSNGHITLGCFNNPTKLNEVVLAEWAKVMHQLPDSRLFLKGRPYSSQAYCERLQNFMAEQGISAERLIIEGPATNHELLEAYNRVDIALDPWPYSGGLTTCEAFLMGVPVVTMPGPTFAGRHSATHLVNAGMPELVTHSWEEYRQRVIGLAADLDSLSTIRSHLRDILLQSPVCDGPRFAKHFTTAMRAIWQRYCEGKEPAALTLNKEGDAQFEGEAQPIELVHPEPLEDKSDFNWEFTGKITTLDNGAVLTSTPGATNLLGLGAFAMISFDPASKVSNPEQLQKAGEFHHYPHVVLGDGSPATLHACLDPAMSATLRPLEAVKTLTGEEPGPKVLTQLPVNSIPLDKIEGLEAIDWLILDNMNDSLAVLENGEKALENTLLIQARVNFQPTHEQQPELTLISHWAARHGFSFYRLNNETHISHLPKRDDLIERQATQLASADAIYIPNAERMAALDNNQRMKLAFVLHTVYGMKDLAYQILAKVEAEKAEAYLKAEGIISPSNSAKGTQDRKVRNRKIFVVGFPKSGTSTIQKALEATGYTSAHWKVEEGFVGDLMYKGLSDHDDPWYYLQNYDAITQADVCLPQHGLNYWPNLDFKIIKRIQELYPDCLFVLNYRDPVKTVSSISRWGGLQERFKQTDIPGLPIGQGNHDDLKTWIENHLTATREFFKNSTNFIEIDIASEQSPKLLQKKLGVEIKWWGVANKNKENLEKHDSKAQPQAFSVPDKPFMSENEAGLFLKSLKRATQYFEFGSGGSTVWAVEQGLTVSGVESDAKWVNALKSKLGERCQVQAVDIGPTREWGYPVSLESSNNFPAYSLAIHKHDTAFDLILVDGRFRVACTLAAIQHILEHHQNTEDARIFIHDFWNRPQYHFVLNFLEAQETVESAGVFKVKEDIDPKKLKADWKKYSEQPA